MQGSGDLDPGLIRMYFVSACIRYDRWRKPNDRSRNPNLCKRNKLQKKKWK